MATFKDTLLSRLPDHIRSDYPRFASFLEAYYDWLCQEGNPYNRLKHHMDYLNFGKSMDAYVSELQNEYLHNIPQDVIVDKELFIKWSKKFNLARGSHSSYKFLFKVLYGEDGTSIYLPKDNILKTSDGQWVSGESTMLLTNSGDLNNIIYKKIRQDVELRPGIIRTATALVQRVKNSYRGRYNLMEISVTDIVGEFDFNYPIQTEDGSVFEYAMPTINRVAITTGGIGYSEGQRVYLTNITPLSIQREVESEGQFDTLITSYLIDNDIQVKRNGITITNFVYDGRTIFSPSFQIGDTITVTFPVYEGYLIVDRVNQQGGIVSVRILDAPVGIAQQCSVATAEATGSGFEGKAIPAAFSPIPGYYLNNRGQLSSDMFLHDSRYYQEFSYVIKTKEQIETYSKVVKDVLHPGGFEMFGLMNIEYLIDLLLKVDEYDVSILPTEIDLLTDYALGPNYSFRDKFRQGLSKRLYQDVHFEDKAFVEGSSYVKFMVDGVVQDIQSYMYNEEFRNISYAYRYDDTLANGISIGCESKLVYRNIDGIYNLVDIQSCSHKLFNTHNRYLLPWKFQFTINDYVVDDYTQDEDSFIPKFVGGNGASFYDPGYINVNYYVGDSILMPASWMTKHHLVDYHLYIPQDYSLEVESGIQYFETGYVSTRV